MGDPAATDAVLQTERLTKVYGARRAVDGLDLRVPRGTVFGLLGQNGAGKSTTIRMVLGLVRPTAGEVRLFGRPLARERLALLARVGCLVEGPAFYPYLSGRKNLKYLGDLTGGATWARVDEVLERVGLGERGHDRYQGYSTGMRQRLGIAGALLHDPELVVLDEPTNGLDPPAVLLVRRLIRALRDEGKTVLVSSHLLHEVELSCEQVAIIERGRAVAQGSVADLLRGEAARVALELPDAASAARALEVCQAHPLVSSARAAGVEVLVTLAEDAPERLNQALVEAGVPVRALVPRRRTLEELFHELAGTALAELAEGASRADEHEHDRSDAGSAA